MKKQKIGYRKKDYNLSEWDELRSVEVIPEKRNRKSELSTSIRLPKGMISRLRKIAAQKGDIGYQTLIKIWLAERLETEVKMKKRA
jgi:predicted DNA binding CopG/RHH family protein